LAAFLTLFGVVALAFASTNLDNLLLLIGWQLARPAAGAQLFTGYALGMLGVLILAVLVGLIGYLFPLEYLGYLGLVPILLGVRLLVENFRDHRGSGPGSAPERQKAVPAVTGTVAIASTQLSNGIDTVLVFAPLLADSRLIFDAEIAGLFLLLALLWFGLARLLGRRALKLPAVERFGSWLAPLVMIGVGVYILGNTATDMG
jgi:cadmium resistance protein CadD (predicted permease)